jgi:CheY-like chemotaxis protein
MSGDLVSLRVLVVCASAPERDLLRQGGALVSVPAEIVEAAGAAEAAAILARGEVDVLLLDGALAAADRNAVMKSARAAAKPPLSVLLAGGAAAAVAPSEHAPDALANKPVVVEEAQFLIDNCVRARMSCRALVVDDSSTMRGIVKKILLASKFQLDIAEADDGAAAVRKVSEEGYDVVFLDYNMPGLDGFATLAELKRARPEVEVVIMTSAPDEVVAKRARAAGATAFLKKPFYPADIDAVLHRIFGLTPMQRG